MVVFLSAHVREKKEEEKRRGGQTERGLLEGKEDDDAEMQEWGVIVGERDINS